MTFNLIKLLALTTVWILKFDKFAKNFSKRYISGFVFLLTSMFLFPQFTVVVV